MTKTGKKGTGWVKEGQRNEGAAKAGGAEGRVSPRGDSGSFDEGVAVGKGTFRRRAGDIAGGGGRTSDRK